MVVEHMGVGKFGVSEEKNVTAERSFWLLCGNIDFKFGLGYWDIFESDFFEAFTAVSICGMIRREISCNNWKESH